MPQTAYNQIVSETQGSVEYFVHASDTIGGRRAGYAGFVVIEGGVYYAKTAYGSLGTRYRTTDLGAFASLDHAKREVDKAFHGKLKKNYREDTHSIQQNQAKPQAKSSSSVNNPHGFPESIPIFSHFAPGQIEFDTKLLPIEDEKVVLEWYPNRMRFKFFVLYSSGIGIYNISGSLEEHMAYPTGYDNRTSEFVEMAQNGLMFLGYRDPIDNIVLLRYIAEASNTRATEVSNYLKQRSIMMMILYTLTDDSNISITSPSNPIYANPKIVLSTDKEEAINNRVSINRYSNNLVVFIPDDNMSVLNCIER